MAKNHKLWALSGSFRVGHWGVKLTKITKLHTRHSFFRTSTSTFDVSQRVIFPCQLIRSRILSETEGKLFSKFVLHGPHIFFLLQNPKSLVQGPDLHPQAKEIWCWKFFQNQYQTQVLKLGSVQSGVSNKNVNHFFVKGCSSLINSTFFWGRWCKQGIIEAEVSRLVILRHGIG